MVHLPPEVIFQILRRVPARSLLRCRAVCKFWRRIIDHPSFIRSLAAAQHSSSTNFLCRNSNGSSFFSFSWDSLRFDCTSSDQDIQTTIVKAVDLIGVPRLPTLPAASCDGLFLISHYYRKRPWVIWNPLTRGFHVLPKPDPEEFCSGYLSGSGIGYDPVGDDYKVVRIAEVFIGKTTYQTLIYSVKEGEWEEIESRPIGWLSQRENNGIYSNGSLYWKASKSVIALDLATEEFRALHLPLPKSLPYIDWNLDVLGGYLAFSYSCDNEGVVVWVMREKEKWTKLFPVSGQPGLYNDLYCLRPMAYWESKGEIVFLGEGVFYWWKSSAGTIKKVSIPWFHQNRFTAQIWAENLVQLDNDLGDGDAERRAQTKIQTEAEAKRKRKRNGKGKATGPMVSALVRDLYGYPTPTSDDDEYLLTENEFDDNDG